MRTVRLAYHSFRYHVSLFVITRPVAMGLGFFGVDKLTGKARANDKGAFSARISPTREHSKLA